MTDVAAWVQEALPPPHDAPHRAGTSGVKSPGHTGLHLLCVKRALVCVKRALKEP
jgi:hypothetical protein